MAKRMLIDATHPEETRVVVVSGKKLEEFDFETTSKKQLKGNIYLAKVTRVEPSLQAAFVDYGGNRHGFLAFSEIHPDYYRIPVADREALLAEEAALSHAEDADEADDEPDENGTDAGGLQAGEPTRHERALEANGSFDDSAADFEAEGSEAAEAGNGHARGAAARTATDRLAGSPDEPGETADAFEAVGEGDVREGPSDTLTGTWPGNSGEEDEPEPHPVDGAPNGSGEDPAESGANGEADGPNRTKSVETIGGDEIEEVAQPRRARTMRRYKIQEVIKRRQIMLVQVTKEERGNKGAALTTYLSLAGRYCVLMPNTARGGGISRKITNPADRKRLKSIIEELEIPEGMAVIVRTAGSERSKAEIRRDYEYLLRLWDEIRELTLRSTAPALIYEEANLIKRSIRDLYSRDIEDILVEGEEGYKAAKAFMRTLTPSHAKRVQLYKDPTIPLFHRYQVESQLDAIHNPVVQLKSGGYIVINPTEALVAIDVNSGRATRERNIEETALRTNLEAAEEIARQLRLRDLAGLIVIDFIDMEEQRHNAQVERRLKEAMRNDRARIQVGHISPFGLLELSRQRLRPSLVETSTEVCPRCRGIGYIRSTESTALHVLRSIEEEGIRNRSTAITVEVPTAVALYILNQKRRALAEIEARHGLRVFLDGDDTLVPPDFRIERMKTLAPEAERAHPVSHVSAPLLDEEFEEVELEEGETEETAETAEAGEERGGGRRRSRRRRRRRDEARPEAEAGETAAEAAGEEESDEARAEAGAPADESAEEPGQRRRRRRGRRGGRRRGRRSEQGAEVIARPEEVGAAATTEQPAEPVGPEPTSSEPAGNVVTIPILEAHEVVVREAELQVAESQAAEPHGGEAQRVEAQAMSEAAPTVEPAEEAPAEAETSGGEAPWVAVEEEPLREEMAVGPEPAPSEPPAQPESIRPEPIRPEAIEAKATDVETTETETTKAEPSGTEPSVAPYAWAEGEPAPRLVAPARPEAPFGEREPEAAPHEEAAARPEDVTGPEPAPPQPVGLQPDQAHRSEPASPSSDLRKDEAPSSTERFSYMPLPAASRDESEPDSAEEDHSARSDRAESVVPVRRRGWWQRHAE